MNICESVEQQLSHFVLAQLDADETLRVVRHLAACEKCGQEEANLRRTNLLLRKWEDAPVQEDLRQRISNAGREELMPLARQTSIINRRVFQSAAKLGLTWGERWVSLIEATRLAQRRVAPFAFATVAAATLCAVLVLLREQASASRTAAIFLAGMWCASVANGLIGLVWGEGDDRASAAQQVDLRATALLATGAGSLVAALFVIAGLMKTLWLGDFMRAEALRLGTYSLASFVIVAAAVATFSKERAGSDMLNEGRISGALVGVIYAAIAAPIVYIVMGFQFSALSLSALAAVAFFAVAGGLTGDFFALKRTAAS